jgi:glyceraldehyde 3-phosphate dehydrogenase
LAGSAVWLCGLVVEHQQAGEIEVVAINNSGTAEVIAHLFAFDSVHGRYPAI